MVKLKQKQLPPLSANGGWGPNNETDTTKALTVWETGGQTQTKTTAPSLC